MLPDHTVILPNAHGDITKEDVRTIVRELYRAECQHSINPDDKVREALAAELVAYLLSVANV